jgi:hypothetical protein
MPKGYHKNTNTPIFRTHGMSNTRFYTIWKSIEQRCFDKNCKTYKSYGNRGINCEWKSFEEFYNDMIIGYTKHCNEFGKENTSIDRINNNGNYCKQNCKWATATEQANNRRSNHFLTFRGEIKSMAEWAKQLNMGYMLIKKRIIRGWSVERTLTEKQNSKFCNQLTRSTQLIK